MGAISLVNVTSPGVAAGAWASAPTVAAIRAATGRPNSANSRGRRSFVIRPPQIRIPRRTSRPGFSPAVAYSRVHYIPGTSQKSVRIGSIAMYKEFVFGAFLRSPPTGGAHMRSHLIRLGCLVFGSFVAVTAVQAQQ